MRADIVLLVVLMAVMAGCSSRGSEPQPPPDEPASMSGATKSEEFGALDGIVTDNEQVPIRGANVVIFHVLMEETHSAITAEDGRFSFSQLRPGEYLASADALFFRNQTKKIEVLAGTSTRVTFELVDVVKSTVLMDTHVKKGFINCSIAAVGDGQMYGPANYCEPLGTDQAKFSVPFLQGREPTGVILEAVWRPATPVTGTALEISFCNKKDSVSDPRNCRNVVTNTYFRWIRGSSPLVLRVNDLPWKQYQAYDTIVGDGGITGARAPVTFQQAFDFWISVCYVAVCPPDFQAGPPP